MNLRYINYVILRDRYVNGFSFEDALVGRSIEDIRAKSITFLFPISTPWPRNQDTPVR